MHRPDSSGQGRRDVTVMPSAPSLVQSVVRSAIRSLRVIPFLNSQPMRVLLEKKVESLIDWRVSVLRKGLTMIWLVIVLLIVVPVGWLVSEFQPRIWLRISLGVAAISMSYFVAWLAGSLTMINYNTWYGTASTDLIETVIANVEAGNDEPLLRELKRLKEDTIRLTRTEPTTTSWSTIS